MRSSTWSALGNTYLVAEPSEGRLDAAGAQELARGVDGVVEIVAATADRVEIVIWNPDGSRAELSGNGTRIAAAWLADSADARIIDVVVGDRVVRSTIGSDGVVEQDMGSVVVGESATVAGIDLIPVSVGNPHAVVIGDPSEVTRLGPLLETHPQFPERTNVQVVRVDGPGDVTARVWERGVGETASSGTSAVAVAAATHGAGDVVVHFPGGDLRVRLENGRATLFGTAARID